MIVGVDLGGSNLRAAALDGDVPVARVPAIHRRVRELVGEPRDPARVVERVAAAVEALAAGADGPVAVGVGIAAMLSDGAGTVAHSPHLRWDHVAFGRLLAARLGPRFPLGVYNDVNAVTYGEAVAGAARGCRDVLGVYVGTGIGGGVICGGQLVVGARHCAGEIGHVKVRWDERAAPCACGQRGCVEAYAGGSYLLRRIRDELAAGASPATLALAGTAAAAHPGHVDQAARAGDAWALALWRELAPLLAVALGGAIAVLNPERLVLGGGVLARCPTLYELVVDGLAATTPAPAYAALTVAPAALGDDAGVVGAARLAAAGVAII